MQLRRARLCIDCEEIHEAQQCPSCASETFAYLTRWVPAPERPVAARAFPPPRVPSPKVVIGYGVVGLAAMGVVRWLMSGKKHLEDAAMKKNIGELK